MSYHKSSTSILSSLDKDYIEEGRGDIYKWGEKRSTRRRGIRGWAYAFKKRFIDKSILRSFLNNLTVSLLLQLILSALFTYTCQRLGLYLDVHIALFVSPIVFPLAFSINADFQRREHVLEDLALFKGGLIVLFFCHRDWHGPAGLSQEFLKSSTNKLKGLILNVKEYLLTEDMVKRKFILQVIYEDFSDISQMNEKLRLALSDSAPLIARLIHCHNLMFWAFERLRVIREYRSPRGIRSFTKVFIFLMPILLSPYYVFVGKSSENVWGPYYISLLTTFVFGSLQGVQDVLDDPFDGISEDDVNLGSLEDWTAHSLLLNRTYTVGRFTVTASVNTPSEEGKKDTLTVETRKVPSRNVSFKERVNAPLRSILRRGSHRPEVRDIPDKLSNVSDDDVGALFPAEMALSLTTMNKKGVTGSTTILPGFHIKEDHPDHCTLLSPSADLQRSFSDVTELASLRRRAYRNKNVSFSQDLDDDTADHSPERLSETSLNATDSLPLLDKAKFEVNRRSKALEPDPDKFSKQLLESMGKLQHKSGTERVCPERRSSKDNMPSSLATLFQPSTSSKPSDCSSQNLNKRKLTSVSNPNELEKEDKKKGVDKPSRFSVGEADNDLLQKNPTATSENQVDPKPSMANPSSQASSTRSSSPHQSSPARSPSPNDKVNVQLPSRIFQVSSSTPSPEPPNDQHPMGQTNLALSNEDTTPAKPTLVSLEDQKRPSRFSVTSPSESKPGDQTPKGDQKRPSRFSVTSPSESKPGDPTPQGDQKRPSRFSISNPQENNTANTVSKEDQKPSRFSVAKQPPNSSNNTAPQEDCTLRERQSSFWDFSTEDSVDGDPTSTTTPNRAPSVEDVLCLPYGSKGEVFI